MNAQTEWQQYLRTIEDAGSRRPVTPAERNLAAIGARMDAQKAARAVAKFARGIRKAITEQQERAR